MYKSLTVEQEVGEEDETRNTNPNDLAIGRYRHTKPHTKPYPSHRKRVKGTLLGIRLEQLRIKVQPKDTREEPKIIIERVHMSKRGNNPTVSKHNNSRVGAALARRLRLLIRSHLQKKGLG